jgi:predicted amidohydrolase
VRASPEINALCSGDDMKVAVVQFRPDFKNKAENISRLRNLILEAAEHGASLIVLPELCATGYSFMSEEEALPFAESLQWLAEGDVNPDTMMGLVSELSRKLEVAIIFGFVEIDSGTKKLYNSQAFVGPDGYFDSYRKINFFGNDNLWCSRGDRNPPVIRCSLDGQEVRVGLLICRDVRDKKNDEWSNFYSPGDADIVCLSSAWGRGGFPATAWMDFVSDNRMTLAVANVYGKESHNDFGMGGVCVITPSGKVHCTGLTWNQDCIVYSEVL